MTNQIKIFSIPKSKQQALYINGILELVQCTIGIYDIKNLTPIVSIDQYFISNFDKNLDYFPETIEEFPKRWEFKFLQKEV